MKRITKIFATTQQTRKKADQLSKLYEIYNPVWDWMASDFALELTTLWDKYMTTKEIYKKNITKEEKKGMECKDYPYKELERFAEAYKNLANQHAQTKIHLPKIVLNEISRVFSSNLEEYYNDIKSKFTDYDDSSSQTTTPATPQNETPNSSPSQIDKEGLLKEQSAEIVMEVPKPIESVPTLQFMHYFLDNEYHAAQIFSHPSLIPLMLSILNWCMYQFETSFENENRHREVLYQLHDKLMSYLCRALKGRCQHVQNDPSQEIGRFRSTADDEPEFPEANMVPSPKQTQSSSTTSSPKTPTEIMDTSEMDQKYIESMSQCLSYSGVMNMVHLSITIGKKLIHTANMDDAVFDIQVHTIRFLMEYLKITKAYLELEPQLYFELHDYLACPSAIQEVILGYLEKQDYKGLATFVNDEKRNISNFIKLGLAVMKLMVENEQLLEATDDYLNFNVLKKIIEYGIWICYCFRVSKEALYQDVISNNDLSYMFINPFNLAKENLYPPTPFNYADLEENTQFMKKKLHLPTILNKHPFIVTYFDLLEQLILNQCTNESCAELFHDMKKYATLKEYQRQSQFTLRQESILLFLLNDLIPQKENMSTFSTFTSLLHQCLCQESTDYLYHIFNLLRHLSNRPYLYRIIVQTDIFKKLFNQLFFKMPQLTLTQVSTILLPDKHSKMEIHQKAYSKEELQGITLHILMQNEILNITLYSTILNDDVSTHLWHMLLSFLGEKNENIGESHRVLIAYGLYIVFPLCRHHLGHSLLPLMQKVTSILTTKSYDDKNLHDYLYLLFNRMIHVPSCWPTSLYDRSILQFLFSHLDDKELKSWMYYCVTMLTMTDPATITMFSKLSNELRSLFSKVKRENRLDHIYELLKLLQLITHPMNRNALYIQNAFQAHDYIIVKHLFTVKKSIFDEALDTKKQITSHFMCIEILKTIQRLISRNADMQLKLLTDKNCATLYKGILHYENNQPSSEIYDILLDIMVDGKFDPMKNYTIKNPRIIPLFFDLCLHTTTNEAHKYIKIFITICNESLSNRESCSSVQLIHRILKISKQYSHLTKVKSFSLAALDTISYSAFNLCEILGKTLHVRE